MSDHTSRLAPRSAGAAADFELLRVARTDLDEPETDVVLTLADRIRGLAPFRAARPTGVASGVAVGSGRREG